jgi:hypothetical protein
MFALAIALLVFLFQWAIEPLFADHESIMMGISWLNTTWTVMQVAYLALSNFNMTIPLITIAWLLALGIFSMKALALRLMIKLIPVIGKIFNI